MPFRHPFGMVVAGPSRSGKTYMIKRIIDNAKWMITPQIQRIVYCYANWQPIYNDMAGVEFHQGLEILEELKNGGVPTLLVIDDHMTIENPTVRDMLTRYSHHGDLSVIFLTQNLFYKGKHNRDITLNAGYLIVMKSPRDASSFRDLARQMYPGESSRYLIDAYEDAAKKPHGYLT